MPNEVCTLCESYGEQISAIGEMLVRAGLLTKEEIGRQGVQFAVRYRFEPPKYEGVKPSERCRHFMAGTDGERCWLSAGHSGSHQRSPEPGQETVNILHKLRGTGAQYMRLLKSPESGKWYAQDEGGQTIAHGFANAAACARAVEYGYETPPYEPQKSG